MCHFFHKIEGILLNKSLKIQIKDTNWNFKEQKIFRQKLLQDFTYSAFSKVNK